jgi:hypothetical protein
VAILIIPGPCVRWDASSGVRVTVPSSDRSGVPPLLKYGTPSFDRPERNRLSCRRLTARFALTGWFAAAGAGGFDGTLKVRQAGVTGHAEILQDAPEVVDLAAGAARSVAWNKPV